MRWEDAPFVKLYRDDGPWMDLSLEARGLFAELLKVVDRAGILRTGPDAARTVARAVNGELERVRTYLAELMRDGCVTSANGSLVIGNYIEAQSARASDKARQAESRRRARDQVSATSNQQLTAENVTHESRVETKTAEVVTTRIEETRIEEKKQASPSATRVSFDLEAIYQRYPRKKGKAEGLAKLKVLIRTAADYEAVSLGVARYVDEITRDKTEPQYVLYFSTWVNSKRWLDYSDGEANSTVPQGTRRLTQSERIRAQEEAERKAYANAAVSHGGRGQPGLFPDSAGGIASGVAANGSRDLLDGERVRERSAADQEPDVHSVVGD